MGNAKKNQKLKFKYVIPDQLPDCYVNGAFGGITPRGEIHMHLYSERNPIPVETIMTVDKEKGTVKKIENVSGGDVIRLVQSSIIMDIDTAINIRNWMNDRIKAIEERKESAIDKSKNKSKRKGGK